MLCVEKYRQNILPCYSLIYNMIALKRYKLLDYNIYYIIGIRITKWKKKKTGVVLNIAVKTPFLFPLI